VAVGVARGARSRRAPALRRRVRARGAWYWQIDAGGAVAARGADGAKRLRHGVGQKRAASAVKPRRAEAGGLRQAGRVAVHAWQALAALGDVAQHGLVAERALGAVALLRGARQAVPPLAALARGDCSLVWAPRPRRARQARRLPHGGLVRAWCAQDGCRRGSSRVRAVGRDELRRHLRVAAAVVAGCARP